MTFILILYSHYSDSVYIRIYYEDYFIRMRYNCRQLYMLQTIVKALTKYYFLLQYGTFWADIYAISACLTSMQTDNISFENIMDSESIDR